MWGSKQGDNKSVSDLLNEKDTLGEFAKDLPDLAQLGADAGYAKRRFRAAVLKRFIPLLLADLGWHLLLCGAGSYYTGWAVILAPLTGAVAWPIARAGVLGRVEHYMASYSLLGKFLQLRVGETVPAEESLTGEQLASLTRAGK